MGVVIRGRVLPMKISLVWLKQKLAKIMFWSFVHIMSHCRLPWDCQWKANNHLKLWIHLTVSKKTLQFKARLLNFWKRYDCTRANMSKQHCWPFSHQSCLLVGGEKDLRTQISWKSSASATQYTVYFQVTLQTSHLFLHRGILLSKTKGSGN